MSSNDELITSFLAVTGATDPSTATQYVEMAGGNLDMAISLYMEHNNTSGGGGPSAGAAAGGSSMLMDDDQVRAPDQTRTMRLFDETAGGGAYSMVDPSVRMMQEMMEEQLARSAFAAPPPAARDAVDAAAAAANNDEEDGMNNDNNNADEYQYDDDSDDDYEMMDNAETSGPPAAPTLQDMFSPPSHIMHKAGGFQGARQMAKDSKRWLLVNVQKDAEFSSHALNRDVWRNDLVENLIQEGFIFWQEVSRHLLGVQQEHEYNHLSQ